jgi:predicted DNA-binding protein (UPF0251 family)
MTVTTAHWVKDRLGGYVRLSIAERREAVALATSDGFNQSETAEILGVDKATVSRDVASATGEPLDVVAALAADENLHKAAKRAQFGFQRGRNAPGCRHPTHTRYAARIRRLGRWAEEGVRWTLTAICQGYSASPWQVDGNR